MKGVSNYLVVALALMALACSIASADDTAPLQDFCVAVNTFHWGLCCDKTNILGSLKKQKNSRIANNHNTNSIDTKI
jgi:hypothetical protein